MKSIMINIELIAGFNVNYAFLRFEHQGGLEPRFIKNTEMIYPRGHYKGEVRKIMVWYPLYVCASIRINRRELFYR
jgi:hypothetical protein